MTGPAFFFGEGDITATNARSWCINFHVTHRVR